ncbi:MAG: T9SS type A sorting domain-containing protein, partial [Candidatus Kapaibacterium sp.]
MGISQKDDGSVSFSEQTGKGRIVTINFPKNSWGLILTTDDKRNTNPEIPKFAPVIVTDAKGNKRMMQFTSEKDGMHMNAMQIESRYHHDGNGSGDSEENMDHAVKIENQLQVGGTGGDIDELSIGHLDPNTTTDSHLEINVQAESSVTSDDANTTSQDQNQTKIIVKTDRRVTDTTVNGKPAKVFVFKNIVRKDSTLHSRNHANMDSTLREAHKSLKIAEQQIKMINIDSIYRSASEVMKKAADELKKINTNSLFNEANKNLKRANEDLKMMNLDSIMKAANENLKQAEEIMAKRCNQLNHLVPILVRTGTKDHYNKQEDITYDDGLIFWYENTPDFIKAAKSIPVITSYRIDDNADSVVINTPNGKKVITKTDLSVNEPTSGVNQVLSRSIIYPNPAKNTTTVRFNLSEPRTLAFSIHDLLGKRVMEGGNLSATSAGSFEKELNVSELPAGVYLLVITTDKGEQSMQRLVIEK